MNAPKTHDGSLEDVVRTLAKNHEILEIKMGTMADSVTTMAKTVHKIEHHIYSQPKAETAEQRIKIVGITIAIFSGALALANGWFDSRNAAMALTVTRIERSSETMDVLRYRVDQLESRLASVPKT